MGQLLEVSKRSIDYLNHSKEEFERILGGFGADEIDYPTTKDACFAVPINRTKLSSSSSLERCWVFF